MKRLPRTNPNSAKLRIRSIAAGVISLLAVAGICPNSAFADYAIQVGSFRSSALAANRASSVARLGYPSMIESSAGTHAVLKTVLVGPFRDTREAQAIQTTLAASGIKGFIRFYRSSEGRSRTSDLSVSHVVPVTAVNDLQNSIGAGGSSNTDTSVGQSVQLAASEPSQAAEPQPKPDSSFLPFSYSGHIQSAVAYTVATPDHWSKIKNTLALAVERELMDDVKLKISGRFSYDGAYDASNFYPERVRRDQRFDGLFHETYLDVGLNDWSFRLGRQNIVWGEVVGLFFADVVTAKDLREFLVPEFDYIRIPQWAARTEYFKGDFKAEAVWIPYMTYDRIGKPGSDFYPYTIPPPPGFAQNIRSERTPHSLRDSSFGLRASYLTHGWDLAAFYYNSMDANTTFFRSTSLAPAPTIYIRPDHERIHQGGLTMSKDMGSFILKGEAIYTWDRYFSVTNASDADGVVRQNFLDYILSAEIPLPMQSRINLQFFQRIFTNHDPAIVPSRVENGATLLASIKLFNDKVEPELLTIQSLNRVDWMTRFKVSWEFAQNWRLVTGTAFFGGKKLGLFGRFDQQDRVFTELRYTF